MLKVDNNIPLWWVVIPNMVCKVTRGYAQNGHIIPLGKVVIPNMIF